MLFGIMVLLVGVIFLLQNLGVIQGNVWDIFWPVLLIVFGLGLMASRRKHCWFCGGHHHGHNKEEWHKFGDEMREKFGHHHHDHNDEHKKEDEPVQDK